MRQADELETRWARSGISRHKHLVFYCGTGWRASEAWFYAWIMGWPSVSVFDGGWHEWSSDLSNPVLVGGGDFTVSLWDACVCPVLFCCCFFEFMRDDWGQGNTTEFVHRAQSSFKEAKMHLFVFELDLFPSESQSLQIGTDHVTNAVQSSQVASAAEVSRHWSVSLSQTQATQWVPCADNRWLSGWFESCACVSPSHLWTVDYCSVCFTTSENDTNVRYFNLFGMFCWYFRPVRIAGDCRSVTYRDTVGMAEFESKIWYCGDRHSTNGPHHDLFTSRFSDPGTIATFKTNYDLCTPSRGVGPRWRHIILCRDLPQIHHTADVLSSPWLLEWPVCATLMSGMLRCGNCV